MDFPWTLHWYGNSPSLSNLIALDDFPGPISPVSNVLPSSPDVAVCVAWALLAHTTESPAWTSNFSGSKLRLFIVTVFAPAFDLVAPLAPAGPPSRPARLTAQTTQSTYARFMIVSSRALRST